MMTDMWTKFMIKKAKVISFDIFDTCLLRPFNKPSDVFKYLGAKFDEPEFFQHRVQAEASTAREKFHKEHVNYDEIYASMPKQYLYLKEKEAELEFNTIYCNPEIKQLYDYAVKLNKKIIFTTDMYCSCNYLRQLLEKNGYKKNDDIYISAELQRSKWHKTLFPYIIDRLQIRPEYILHIGDNIMADYRFPRELGIRTVKVVPPRERLLRNPHIRKFIDDHPDSLTAGMIIGLFVKNLVRRKSFKNYWHEFGFIFGGPACYGLCQFIINEMEKNDRRELLCVARDGYTIEKIVNILAPSVKTHYVYASRLINILTSLETDVATWTTYSEGIIKSYSETSVEFRRKCRGRKFKNSTEMSDFISENMDILRPLADGVFNTYLRYIHALQIKEKKVALFDVNAGHFNSYKLLKKALPEKDFLGLYWLITGEKICNCIAYSDDIPPIRPWQLLEFIITAPELPIKNMNPDGTFTRVTNRHEKYRVDAYKDISTGEVDFSKLYYLTFEDYLPFEASVCVDLLNTLGRCYTLRDHVHFRSVYHGMSLLHTKYVNLMGYSILERVRYYVLYYICTFLSRLLRGRLQEQMKKRLERYKQLIWR